MRRREFISLLGGATLTWPLTARAQQPASARLGVLLYSNPTADPQMRTVLRALGDLGYVEGRNIDITYRYAEGSAERLPDMAAELVRLKPDVIEKLSSLTHISAPPTDRLSSRAAPAHSRQTGPPQSARQSPKQTSIDRSELL